MIKLRAIVFLSVATMAVLSHARAASRVKQISPISPATWNSQLVAKSKRSTFDDDMEEDKRMPPGARGRLASKRSSVDSDEMDDSLEKRLWWPFEGMAKRMPPGARGRLMSKRSADDSKDKDDWWNFDWFNKRVPPGARGRPMKRAHLESDEELEKRIPPSLRGGAKSVVKRGVMMRMPSPSPPRSSSRQYGGFANTMPLSNPWLSYDDDELLEDEAVEKRYLDATGLISGYGDGYSSGGDYGLHGMHANDEYVEYKRWPTTKNYPSKVKQVVKRAGFKSGYTKPQFNDWNGR